MASSHLRAFINKYGATLPLMMGLDSDYRYIKDQSDYTRNVRGGFPDSAVPSVIAVMGLPHTGIEPVCEMLGVWLGSPMYDLQAPLDMLSRVEEEADHERLHRVSFDVICRMAGYHLSGKRYGFNCNILGSTFFDYKWQLNRLLDITYELQGRASRSVHTPQILVVQCKRKNKFQWEQSFDEICWKDVERTFQELMRQQGDDDEYFLALSRSYWFDIRKLVVDPFEDISHGVSEFGGRGYSALFARAINDLLECDHINFDEDESPLVVDYGQWRRQILETGRYGWIVATHEKRCRPGDCVFRFTDNLGLEKARCCEICEERIAEEAYYCQFCSLSLHEICATKTTTSNLESSLDDKAYSCYSCIDQGKEFSIECESCLLRTFIKSLPLPLIFKHNGGADDHPLSLRLVDESSPFVCKACGLEGKLASYGCHICKAQYHLGCLRVPLQTKHQHGGHMHTINLQFSCAVEDDGYEWCLVCYKDIDPQTWGYTCQECDYLAHVYCIFDSIMVESQHQLF